MIYRSGLISAAVVLTLAALSTGCNYCGAEEERAITVSTTDSLTITRNAQVTRLAPVSRVGAAEISPLSFDAVFNAIEGTQTPNRALLLTLSGTAATGELVTIVFALPADLDRNDQYTVARTFTAEPGLSTDPGMWGLREVAGANTAEIAFTTSTYSFPPAQHTITYRANAASGMIRVLQRERGWAELDLDITLTDAAGATATLDGRIQVNTERYTPPCT